MKRTIFRFAVFAIAMLVPAFAFAQQGNGMKSGPVNATSYSTVTITIPAVVGIDVESDVAFTLPVAGGALHAQGACGSFFPPAPACRGALTFSPTSVSHTGTLTADANAVWVSMFSNDTGTAVTLSGSLDSVWTGVGAPTADANDTAIQVTAATNNNTFGFPAGATRLGSGAGSSLLGTRAAGATAAFAWTRVDQVVELRFGGAGATNTDASAVTFNGAGARSTSLNFIVAH